MEWHDNQVHGLCNELYSMHVTRSNGRFHGAKLCEHLYQTVTNEYGERDALMPFSKGKRDINGERVQPRGMDEALCLMLREGNGFLGEKASFRDKLGLPMVTEGSSGNA